MGSTEAPVGRAARRWADTLAGWAIPQSIVDQAPESPWGFPLEPFVRSAEESLAGKSAETPAGRRALEALPAGGSVLDVGAGAGAAGLALVPPAARVVAVDPSREMLKAFADLATGAGISHLEVEGSWPEVAADVEVADVVVCHDVAYNVPDLADFAVELTGHARNRVVLRLTSTHPMTWINPLWRRFHQLERPDGPSAEDAVAVLAEAGLRVSEERSRAPGRFDGLARQPQVAFVRQRLCLPASADPEIDAAMGDAVPRTREIVCLWWPGSA